MKIVEYGYIPTEGGARRDVRRNIGAEDGQACGGILLWARAASVCQKRVAGLEMLCAVGVVLSIFAGLTAFFLHNANFCKKELVRDTFSVIYLSGIITERSALRQQTENTVVCKRSVFCVDLVWQRQMSAGSRAAVQI